jgi:predicted ATPase
VAFHADDFAQVVRDALLHLHDLPYLQRHPLADASASPAAAARALQARQLTVVAALRPPDQSAATGRAGLRHAMLTLRYVEGLAVTDVCRRLGVSRSEYHREHRVGLAAIVAALRESTEAPPAGPDRPPSTSLPRTLTSFVGRGHELVEVRELLAQARMVTLTGTGGVGKTRLALEVAARSHGDAAFVDLAAVTDPTTVAGTALLALGASAAIDQAPLDALVQHLGERPLLLVLDNCEHLIEACARLVEGLVRGCPALRVLATSRERLGVAGEVAWRVPSLAVPDPDALPPIDQLWACEAIRLFVERARLAGPGFELTTQSAAAVAGICRRLDGIPLAIELAAARLRVLSIEQIAARLDDRFRILTGGNRTALPRHQTLRGAVDWSHELLSDRERLLFRRLAVFVGGWTLEAAEAVCPGDGLDPSDVLDALTGLIDKSLVVADDERYRFLETLRQYALDRLGAAAEAVALRARHATYVAAFANDAQRLLFGAQGLRWLDRAESEHENMLAALGWAEEHDHHDLALPLVAAVSRLWWVRGYPAEGRRRLEEALARDAALRPTGTRGSAAHAAAATGAGTLAFWQGDLAAARAWYEEAIAIYRGIEDRAGIARNLTNLGATLDRQGHYASARALLDESVALWRDIGDPGGTSTALRWLGEFHARQCDDAQARTCLDECVAIGQEFNLLTATALLGSLGPVFGRDLAAERAALEEGVARLRASRVSQLTAHALIWLGVVAHRQGDQPAARASFGESLALAQRSGYRLIGVEALEGLLAPDATADPERAARLAGAAAALREAMGAPLPPAGRLDHDRALALIHAALGSARFATLHAEGRALPWRHAVVYALGDDPAGV